MSARVLIVEDNPASLELMAYLLTAFGHTVLTAEGGKRGLAAARQERPELIICDIQLPDIDGFEVARRLNADPELCSIPLVAVTALAMVGDRYRVLAAGFDGYVPKPIDPETFVRQMEAFLPIQQHTSAPHLPAAPAAPEWESTPQGPTILAVDNLLDNLELARSSLAPSGYRVITADNMTDGLSLAREGGCHLILSDVCMSGGSGYDFLRAVLADPQLRTIPFILITSTNMSDKDRDLGMAMGATRFLRGPIEPEVLLAEIRACLSEGRTN